MIGRRDILLMGGSLVVLASCGPPGAGTLALSASGGAGMNPGPGGADRPVTISILQLKSPDAFNAADVFALQDPASALGGDLLGQEQMAVAPGGSASKTVTAQAGATHIGLVAGFRDPAGKTYKTAVPIAPGSNGTANITLGSSGMVVSG